ncbi:MAG: DUF3857 domain-containing protein [Candidatus Cloacimonadales bacterium]|nr:DUF3857 domain-containing protein [Candidatus Cloacimonadales bacterium]
MIKRILAFLFLVCCLNIFADRIDDIIQDIAGIDKYPDASAINVLTEIELNIAEDFSYDYHVFYVKKILNYKGTRRYSDVKISYNGDYEKIELGNCFTIDTEGNRIEIPANQIYDMNDTESIQSPDYINNREKIINFPQIEPGYFVVLDYTITSHRCEPVSGVEHLRESNPYLHKTFSIKFPKKLKLNSFCDDDHVEFTKSKVGSFRIYSWHVSESPVYKEENNSPSLLLAGTPIVFSFYKNWQELAEQKLAKLRNVEGNAEISEVAKKLTENCQNETEKVVEIYKFMAENFNEKEAYTSQIDFTPEPMMEVWQKKFGSERELTALFIAMLNEAGIDDAYPAVILSPNDRFGKIQKKFAVADFMDNICTYWQGNLYCAGNSYMPFAYAGAEEANILIGNNKYEFTYYQSPVQAQKIQSYKYNMNENDAAVDVEILYSGKYNQQMRDSFLDWPEAQRKIWFIRYLGEKSATLLAGPIFHNYDKIDEDLKVSYTLQYEDFLVEQQPYEYFKLISPDFRLDVTLDKRDNDYQVSNKIFIKQHFIIELDDQLATADKMQLLNKAQDIIEFKIGDKMAYSKLAADMKDTKIILTKDIYIPECVIPNERYQEFKKFVLEIQNPINNMVFME